MRILAFETSAKSAAVAIVQNGALLGEYFQNSGQTHSRTLMQMAEDLLKNCDITAADIDAVACAAGPGSFTGVRIGMAAAKGFAWGREVPLIGVSTLEAMVRGIACADGVYCAAMDARRSQVYTATFECCDGKLTRLTQDAAISIEELGSILEMIEKDKFLVGDGAALCYNTLSEMQSSLHLMPEHLRMQRAAGVALLAWDRIQNGQVIPAQEVVPNYLRLSQAERERLKKSEME